MPQEYFLNARAKMLNPWIDFSVILLVVSEDNNTGAVVRVLTLQQGEFWCELAHRFRPLRVDFQGVLVNALVFCRCSGTVSTLPHS